MVLALQAWQNGSYTDDGERRRPICVRVKSELVPEDEGANIDWTRERILYLFQRTRERFLV